MHELDAGPLYSRIAEIILYGLGPLDKPTLLYATVEEGAIGVTIAEDRGNYIFFHRLPLADSTDLVDTLVEIWRLRREGERFAEMSFLIADGRFHASLFYPDLLDPTEDPFDRSFRVIAEHFGSKPAQCDPIPDNPDEGYSFRL
ncbi:MAG: hypothetical protein KGL54_04305 [Sphingomonadales bacterium]|nr:hypothetical protein [Sphingomonadales bacterium]